MPPLPPGVVARPEILDIYWHFAAERQRIFFQRLLGLPRPWTSDPILDVHKFCNAYRASDRVSQYLIRHVIYPADAQSYSAEDTAFRILLFKLFNTPVTWQWLETHLGRIELAGFDVARYDALLTAANTRFPIYTSAYITCATQAYGHARKHQNHLALLHEMFLSPITAERLPAKLARARALRDVFTALRAYPLIGDFMAYQLATDLNYSEVIDFPEDSFTAPGPGALRGLRKCFSSFGGHKPEALIHWMQAHQAESFAVRGLAFHSLFGRPLQLIDCQGLFCETDKYTRASHPSLLSNRTRIKHVFRAHPEHLTVAYPPKWRLDTTRNPLRHP